MTTVTPQQAQDRIAALPAPLQDALFSVETSDIIHDIGEKLVFAYSATADLAEVVGLALMGFINPDSVKEELAERIEAKDEILAGAAMQVQDRILNRFHGLLVNAFYSEPGKPNGENAEAPMPIGEVAAVSTADISAPVGGAPKKVNFGSPSFFGDIKPMNEAPDESLIIPVSIGEAPEPIPKFSSTMEDAQAASPASKEASMPVAMPVPDPAPAAPFVLREEGSAGTAVGNINMGAAFGVDSGDQFRKGGTSETPDKPQAASVEFAPFAPAEVNYGAPITEDNIPAPPERAGSM